MSAFIDKHRDRFGVEPICRTLGDSASAYWKRATGERSRRRVEDECLVEAIRQPHARNWYAQGYRQVWLALRRDGHEVGRDRVRRLMPRPDALWVADFERHEALLNRVEVKDLHCRAVVAAWCSSGQPDPRDGGEGGSGPDNDGTGQHCQMVWVRLARREGVREEPTAERPSRDPPARIWQIWAGQQRVPARQACRGPARRWGQP